jgi:hypothetical protein
VSPSVAGKNHTYSVDRDSDSNVRLKVRWVPCRNQHARPAWPTMAWNAVTALTGRS